MADGFEAKLDQILRRLDAIDVVLGVGSPDGSRRPATRQQSEHAAAQLAELTARFDRLAEWVKANTAPAATGRRDGADYVAIDMTNYPDHSDPAEAPFVDDTQPAPGGWGDLKHLTERHPTT